MLSIDITDKQVKLVRGTLSGNKIRVLEVETRDLTLGSVSNGYITDIPMVAGEITDGQQEEQHGQGAEHHLSGTVVLQGADEHELRFYPLQGTYNPQAQEDHKLCCY